MTEKSEIARNQLPIRREPKPYRIVARIKNNRLWTAILLRFPDVRSQADAARRLGIPPTSMASLLNMKYFPYGAHGWHRVAIAIAVAVRETEEYLFDPELYGRPISPMAFEVAPTAGELERIGLVHPALAPDDAAENVLLRQRVEEALTRLTARESAALRLRYGLDGEGEKTLEEVGARFDVTQERIRQIEAKALRKLRHPSLSDGLVGFVR